MEQAPPLNKGGAFSLPSSFSVFLEHFPFVKIFKVVTGFINAFKDGCYEDFFYNHFWRYDDNNFSGFCLSERQPGPALKHEATKK